MFSKFAKFPAWGWALVGVLLVLGVAVYAWTRSQKGRKLWTTRMMSVGAICMALSSVLSLVRLFRMPMGGSITPASMLPLLLFAYVYGAGPGVSLGLLYGVMQFILDGGEFAWAGLIPNLLDYPLAFGMLGLCGLFGAMRDTRKGLLIGVIVGCAGRFLCSFLSGWVFYGEYAPEGMSPILYAAAYNGAYMGVECAICIAIAALIGVRLVRELKKVA
ncbi:MAG: energy-coupled thiamine transporter ThiT [Clostridia bacterium]|nr:energy-coupled thiamine transporter ThiT [Clostridia bacterium]